MKGVANPIKTQELTVYKPKRAWWSLWLYKREVPKRAVKLLEDVDYYGITVPAGFVFDFASIPRGVWSYMSPDEPGIRIASLVHDWLYNKRGKITPDHIPADDMLRHFARLKVELTTDGCVQFSRHACDKVFLEIMTLRKFRADKRLLAYQAVDKFGWIYWNKPQEQTQ